MIWHRIRRLFGLKPPYEEARRKLHASISAGQLDPNAPLDPMLIDRICGWDSKFDGPDWVEWEMWSEELNAQLKTNADFVRMLEAIDSRYQS